MEPLAIEIRIAEELVVRGQEWPVQGPPVVMLHDLGDDLDSWKGVDWLLADRGFRVISLDLPNHGLSDDQVEDSSTLETAINIIKNVSEVWGPVGLCSYGTLSTELCHIQGTYAPITHVMVSPLAPKPRPALIDGSGEEMYQLVIAATNGGARSEEARVMFDSLGKKKLWASVAATEHGPEFLKSHPHLVDDMAIFFKRTLTSDHLAWTATTHKKAAAEFHSFDSKREQ